MSAEIIATRIVRQLADAPDGAKVYMPASVTQVNAPAFTNPAVQEYAEQYFENPDRLAGDKPATNAIITEKPIHRSIIYLHACGASPADIASQTGFTVHHVRHILRQPWARQRLVQILNETGRDRVKHFLQQEVSSSLEVLREVRDDSNASAAARIAASNAILDRALGKPVAFTESKSTITNIPAEAARIDAELRSVREQLASKGADFESASGN